MKYLKTKILIGLLSLLSVFIMGNLTSHADTTNPFVYDHANVISNADKQKIYNINKKLYTKKQKPQIFVITVNKLPKNTSVEQAADKQFEKYKFGNPTYNNGLLIYVAIKDKKVRVANGSGLDSKMTNGDVDEIVDDTAKEQMQENDYSSGILTMVQNAQSDLNNIYAKPSAVEQSMNKHPLITTGVIIAFILCGLFLVILPVILYHVITTHYEKRFIKKRQEEIDNKLPDIKHNALKSIDDYIKTHSISELKLPNKAINELHSAMTQLINESVQHGMYDTDVDADAIFDNLYTEINHYMKFDIQSDFNMQMFQTLYPDVNLQQAMNISSKLPNNIYDTKQQHNIIDMLKSDAVLTKDDFAKINEDTKYWSKANQKAKSEYDKYISYALSNQDKAKSDLEKLTGHKINHFDFVNALNENREYEPGRLSSMMKNSTSSSIQSSDDQFMNNLMLFALIGAINSQEMTRMHEHDSSYSSSHDDDFTGFGGGGSFGGGFSGGGGTSGW